MGKVLRFYLRAKPDSDEEEMMLKELYFDPDIDEEGYDEYPIDDDIDIELNEHTLQALGLSEEEIKKLKEAIKEKILSSDFFAELKEEVVEEEPSNESLLQTLGLGVTEEEMNQLKEIVKKKDDKVS